MNAIESEIFLAQHYGNVSPEEYMVPYPNIGELLTGQNIKLGDKIVFSAEKINNKMILERSAEFANWLLGSGIVFGDRIRVSGLSGPEALFLAYGAWRIGASLVIGHNNSGLQLDIKLTITSNTLPNVKELNSLPKTVFVPETLSLNDEAIVLLSNKSGIKLSHYNLLVNAVGIQQMLGLDNNSRYYANVKPLTLPWVILYSIMPLTSGAIFSNEKDSIILDSREKTADYWIHEKWNTISEEERPGLYFLPEAGGVLSIGNQPVPLLKYDLNESGIKIQGHSVMMGFTDDTMNKTVFRKGWAYLDLPAGR